MTAAAAHIFIATAAAFEDVLSFVFVSLLATTRFVLISMQVLHMSNSPVFSFVHHFRFILPGLMTTPFPPGHIIRTKRIREFETHRTFKASETEESSE